MRLRIPISNRHMAVEQKWLTTCQLSHDTQPQAAHSTEHRVAGVVTLCDPSLGHPFSNY